MDYFEEPDEPVASFLSFFFGEGFALLSAPELSLLPVSFDLDESFDAGASFDSEASELEPELCFAYPSAYQPDPLNWIAGEETSRSVFPRHFSHFLTGESLIF